MTMINFLKTKKIDRVLLNIAIYCHIISWVIFTPVFQFEMILFNRRIFTFFHFGLLEMLSLFILIFKRGKITLNSFSKLFISTIIVFLFSCLVNALWNSNIDLYTVSFYLMTWVLPFILLFVITQYKIDKKDIINIMYFMVFVCIIHALLIFIQRLSNNLIWPFLDYGNGEAVFFSDNGYYGDYMNRCPGLTISGLDAGILLIFGLVAINCIKAKKIIKNVIIMLFISAIPFTGTRNIYILALYVLAVFFIYKIIKARKLRNRMLIISTIFFSIFYFLAISSVKTFKSTGNLLTDNMSIMYRTQAWDNVLNLILKSPFIFKMFGNLSWQQIGGPLVDNLFLETFYCSGIISMVLMIIIVIKMSKKCSYYKTDISSFTAAFMLGFFVYGVLNGMSNFYFTLIIILYTFICAIEKSSSFDVCNKLKFKNDLL